MSRQDPDDVPVTVKLGGQVLRKFDRVSECTVAVLEHLVDGFDGRSYEVTLDASGNATVTFNVPKDTAEQLAAS